MAKKRRKKKRKPLIKLSRDQWLDIGGYCLLAISLLTLLSLASPEQGTLTTYWLAWLLKTCGWGLYITPLFFGGLGLWLVLRHFETHSLKLTARQLVGIGIGFLMLLATLHFIATYFVWPAEDITSLIRKGQGGGYVGGTFLKGLVNVLGPIGALSSLLLGWVGVIVLVAETSLVAVSSYWGDLLSSVFHRGKLLVAATAKEPLGVEVTRQRQATAPVTARNSAARRRKPKSPPPAEEPALQINTPAAQEAETEIIIPRPPGSEWRLPAIAKILTSSTEQSYSLDLIRNQVRIIEETLVSLGAPVKVLETNTGPVITQFGVEPLFRTSRSGKRTKIKVSKIASLADDLALALTAKSIRIEAPIPGKSLVGIEVPNVESAVVGLREVMESKAFAQLESTLRMGLGQDVSGQAVAVDLQAMPHLLIAGATGAGKSVCINAIISALLLQNTPETLRLLLIDPKRVELTPYNQLPHLLAPVIVDVEKVVPALKWVMREMDSRYRRFASVGSQNIAAFNRHAAEHLEEELLPYIVVVVDELADLMMKSAEDTERVICRLAQMARATGIHLIIATQRPSTDVVTGLIKANFPARIAFAVASSVDSRVILDTPGAERLLGSGDMLFQAPDVGHPLRLQGTFVSDHEIERLLEYWFRNSKPGATVPEAAIPTPPVGLHDALVQPALFPEFDDPSERFADELVPAAVEILLAEDRASISLLQRHLRIGYTRSARIIDLLTELGIVTEDVEKGQSRGVNREGATALLQSLETANSGATK
ncbi:MAG: DNA translocase FtsK [Chloroflexota bacterium]|nr:DNA translocase FtsK [Chloroflexota bacterium]